MVDIEPMQASIPLLSLRRASFSQNGQTLFAETDWTVYADQQWAIVGPTGAGKSMLVKALKGKLPLSGGSLDYHFDAIQPAPAGPATPARRGILEVSAGGARELLAGWTGSFHQARWHSMTEGEAPGVDRYLDPQTIFQRTPYEVRETDTDWGAVIRRRDALLAQLGAKSLLDRSLSQLSNGEFRKIRIIRALMQSPGLLILESPFSGLDHGSRKTLAGILEELPASWGTRIMVVETCLEELPRGITHLLCVAGNRVVLKGERKSVERRPELRRLLSAQETGSSLNLPATGGQPEEDGPPLIEMHRVTVCYGKTRILSDISWTVRPGEHWLVLGPNGAGKSSLLSLVLADNPQAYANDIRLFGVRRGSGESIWEIKRRIGWVAPELERAWIRGWTVRQVVCSGFFDSIGLYRRPADEEREEAGRWIEMLGLAHLSERSFSSLSCGEKRMLLIARALVKRPRLLILDEPVTGLDRLQKKRVLDLLDRLSGSQAAQLIYVSHRMEEIPECATHALLLDNGRIAGMGRREAVLGSAGPGFPER
jgi:molybdate transport system ATP-binding protein